MRKAMSSAAVGDDVLGDILQYELENAFLRCLEKKHHSLYPVGQCRMQLQFTHTNPGDEILPSN